MVICIKNLRVSGILGVYPEERNKERDIVINARVEYNAQAAIASDALEDALDMQRGGLKESRDVLRQFGNMSAVTVLFVAERMRLMGRQTMLTALGPGFSAAFLMLDGR